MCTAPERATNLVKDEKIRQAKANEVRQKALQDNRIRRRQKALQALYIGVPCICCLAIVGLLIYWMGWVYNWEAHWGWFFFPWCLLPGMVAIGIVLASDGEANGTFFGGTY